MYGKTDPGNKKTGSQFSSMVPFGNEKTASPTLPTSSPPQNNQCALGNVCILGSRANHLIVYKVINFRKCY